MIEHKAWKGPNYEDGIGGERIAIVGHSHYGDPDHELLTCTIVQDVIHGDEALGFFTSIRNYFGYSSHAEFWNRVVFFDYLPSSIGSASERFAVGSIEQIEVASWRFMRLLGELYPTKVLAFTNSGDKGWQTCPETDQEKAGGQTLPLKGFRGFRWGTYTVNGHVSMAFGLRHPQGADGDQIRRAVEHILTTRFPGTVRPGAPVSRNPKISNRPRANPGSWVMYSRTPTGPLPGLGMAPRADSGQARPRPTFNLSHDREPDGHSDFVFDAHAT